MTEQELREKIINTIKENGVYNGKSMHRDYYVVNDEELADAIIAAGIGDVKEAEYRAEKYERALELMARGECTFASPEYYIKQAEKELAEERKSD